MAGAEVDASRFPLVVQRLPDIIDESDVSLVLEEFDRLLDRGERYAIIVHTESSANLNASQRATFADWQRLNAERIRAANACVAIVLRSAVQRGTLTAMNWLHAPITPQKPFASMLDAVEWCMEMLIAEGAVLTPEALAFERDLRQAQR